MGIAALHPSYALRQLISDEIDVVSGGIIGGCIDVNHHTLFGFTYQLDDKGNVCSMSDPGGKRIF
jgi:hypothetical protein